MNIHSPKDLITIDRSTAFKTFTTEDPETAFAPMLAELRAIVEAWEKPSVETAKGRDEIKSFAFRITKTRTAVEAIGAELAKEAKATPKKIDASRRYIEDAIDEIREAVREPLTKWEAAETMRQKAHTDALAGLARMCEPIVRPLDDMRRDLATVNAVQLGDNCEEYLAEYRIAAERARVYLTGAIAAAEEAAAEAAELAALRAEKARREQEDREADIAASAAREAEKRAKTEAEAREKKLREEKEAAEKAAEEAKAAAVNAAIEAAAKAKADLEAEKAREAEEARKRAEDREIRRKTNNRCVRDLVELGGIDEAAAKRVVRLIASGKIPQVSINY